MNCSHIIDEMTWSYSRISTYEDCPYKFYLSYIKKYPKDKRHFFSDYGTFMHLILEKFFNGELEREELADYYLINFSSNVIGKAPSNKIFVNYFKQGLDYLKNFQPQEEHILGVEKQIEFEIGKNKFVGYIDKLVRRDGGIVVVDNKSKALKERSIRKKPTVSDEELDRYLRQLYLYSIPVENEFGELPYLLEFNCFRTQKIISEPFNIKEYESVKKWATERIASITEESDWRPNIEYFKCKHLCDYTYQCEYFNMYGGDG